MPIDPDALARIEKLETEVAEIKAALLGDMHNPGGALQVIRLVHEELKEVKLTVDSLRLDRAKVVGMIAATAFIAGLIGKYLLK